MIAVGSKLRSIDNSGARIVECVKILGGKNKKNGKKLVYYPCPKNAHTSAMLFFVKHLGLESKFVFIGDKIPKYKQKKNAHNIYRLYKLQK